MYTQEFVLNIIEWSWLAIHRKTRKAPLVCLRMMTFPSVNAAYRLNDKHQFRLSYGRTVNRPEFREVSSSVYYDFDLASNVQGNYNLKPAYIDNLDFGYEFYPSSGELISVSLFYKRFKNPIEWTYTVSGGTDLIYSYVNAKGADNYGVEVDIRKIWIL